MVCRQRERHASTSAGANTQTERETEMPAEYDEQTDRGAGIAHTHIATQKPMTVAMWVNDGLLVLQCVANYRCARVMSELS